MSKIMYTLGIETSCDETSCAVLKDYKVLSNVTVSSLKEHSKYGGVIPEIASRAHLKNIDRVYSLALSTAGVEIKDIGLIAVTSQPGLIGALIVGLNFARALSYSLKKPLINIDHLHAHLFAPFLDYREKIEFPFLGLIVSGGHTQIYYLNDFDNMRFLGGTMDDACGEVFDKVSRALGLGYPGGPVIDRLYDYRYKDEFNFNCGRSEFDLSFSGIKTAVIYKKAQICLRSALNRKIKVKLVSSFQYSVIDTIARTVFDALDKFHAPRLVCGGGVAANKLLREKLGEVEKKGVKFLPPPLVFCGDNAAVVAGLGFYLYNKKYPMAKENCYAN